MPKISTNQLSLVKQDGLAIRSIKEQTEELCATALEQTAEALKHIKK